MFLDNCGEQTVSPIDLPNQSLVVEIPNGDVSIRTAGEADFRVWADGQSITRRRRRCKFCFDPRSRCSQIPDRQGARLAPHDESPSIRKKAAGPDVVISVLMLQKKEASETALTVTGVNVMVSCCTHKAVQLGNWGLVSWVTDVPHLHATLATSVDMACRVTDGNRTHHLPVAESIDLSSVARNVWADQCIWRKRNRLHLSVGAHVKGVRSRRTVETRQRLRTTGETESFD